MKKKIAAVLIAALLGVGIPQPVQAQETESQQPKEDELVTVIVEGYEKPLLEEFSENEDAEEDFATYLNENEAQEQPIDAQNEAVIETVNRLCEGIENTGVLYEYHTVFSGLAVQVPYKYVEKIQKLPQVKSVYVTRAKQMSTAVEEKTEICQTPEQTTDQEQTSDQQIAKKKKPKTSLASLMGADQIQSADQQQYTGEGQVIAIIDSGLGYHHEAFQTPPKNPRYTSKKMQKVLDKKKLVSEVNYVYARREHCLIATEQDASNDVYKSAKIPYAYDYADNDADVTPLTIGYEHGTGVASWAAGDCDKLRGVAPDAQLLAMKVFSDLDGFGEDEREEALLAALEDAVLLHADVINISLGHAGGFDTDAWSEMTRKVYARIEKAGIVLDVGVGNDSLAGREGKKDNLALVENVDCGVVASPAAYRESMGIAAAEDTSGKPADYSSWGPTPTLRIKPELMTPVPKENGATYLDENGKSLYEKMSGTSFASPLAAGASACLLQYVKETRPQLTDPVERVDLINALLMSTAVPGKTDKTVYAPVRQQGAGLANVARAMQTKAYLGVKGEKRPKAELDANKKGQYQFQMTIQNMSEEKLTYDLKAAVQVPKVTTYRKKKCMEWTDLSILKKGAKVTFSGTTVQKNSVTVPAKGKAVVTVKISLDKKNAYLKKVTKDFVNGYYVEGYIFAKSRNKGVDLSLPYLGFCGDWKKAPVLEESIYENKDKSFFPTCMREYEEPDSQDDWTSACRIVRVLGNNPLKYEENYRGDRLVVSARAGAVNQVVSNTMLLRPTKKFRVECRAKDGTKVFSETSQPVWKRVNTRFMYAEDPQWQHYGFRNKERIVFNGYDKNGRPLKEGIYYYSVSALPYGTFSEKNAKDKWETHTYTLHLDNTLPKIKKKETKLFCKKGVYYVTVSANDNLGLAGWSVVGYQKDQEEREILCDTVDFKKKGKHTYRLGTKKQLKKEGVSPKKLTLIVYDYAKNKAYLDL